MADADRRLEDHAPALLAALAECVAWLGQLSNCAACDHCVDDARAVIAKATGGK